MTKIDEDNIRLDPRLMRFGIEALNVVSGSVEIDFFALSLKGKKDFLETHGTHVMKVAKDLAGPLGRYFENRVVMLVENEGRAGLYFTKIKPKVPNGG